MTKSSGPPLLEARNVTKRFGGLVAVKAFTMAVPPGALYGLIGPNGSGKTTVFNLLTGVYDLTEGEIYFDGARIDGVPPHEVVAQGLVLTPEGRKIFPSLTVRENLDLGGYLPPAREPND